ncbi:GNAT family N-acetyltransferase [Amylibacter sp.]|jgi:ElaA protein|nr:GNAT family N-acetyltransferase [Amylibacter sp.]|tara:strand:- start:2540 stop:2974 length:435 start_codon:yes stop_codon:yes gene_type:complete
MLLDIRFTQNNKDMLSCLDLRRTVFIEEQNVPENEEVDGDDPDCDHILLTVSDIPVGAARLKYYNDFIKVQRVCVLKNYRGQGIGSKIINFIIRHVEKNDIRSSVRLGSQIHALEFYKRLGFIEFGEEYLDAGILHKDMEFQIK